MKNLFFLLLTTALVFSACDKEEENNEPANGNNNGNNTEQIKGCIDEEALNFNEAANTDDGSCKYVEAQQMALINKLTATWCPPCGGWGWDLFEDIVDQASDKAILMGTYGSSTSDYFNVTADAFKKSFAPTAGWPAFCANGENYTVYSQNGGIYTDQTRDNIIAKVNEEYNKEADISLAFKLNDNGGNVDIEGKVKAFNTLDGDYTLGFYVLENGVKGYQAGHPSGTQAEHKYLLRGSINDAPFGNELASGGISGDTQIEINESLIKNNDWNWDNCQVVAIIWKKVGIKYYYVNGAKASNW